MTKHDGIKLVYTGSSIDANFIKSILTDNGISCMMRDMLDESTRAAFASGTPENSCRIFVEENQFTNAENLITEYLKSLD